MFWGDCGRGSLPTAVLEADTQGLHQTTSILCILAGREGRKSRAFQGGGKVAAFASPAGPAG